MGKGSVECLYRAQKITVGFLLCSLPSDCGDGGQNRDVHSLGDDIAEVIGGESSEILYLWSHECIPVTHLHRHET